MLFPLEKLTGLVLLVGPYKTYVDAFRDDMQAFEKAGIIPAAYRADVDEVREKILTP